MDFVPLYYGERLRVVNPTGDVGIVTLWSKVESVVEVLSSLGVDFSPETSRVAVVANLYGNGLPQMLRNLLHNPEIRIIVICGKNLSGSREWLMNFFSQGLEEITFLGAPAFRIIGTERVIDGKVQPEDFKYPPEISTFGEIGSSETKEQLQLFFTSLAPALTEDLVRVDPPEIPEPAVMRFPSNPAGHQVIRRTPSEAWREIIFRLHRFGHRNTVMKSSGPESRVELLNVHAVVEEPAEEPESIISSLGFSLSKFHDYQGRILDPVKPPDLDYTYGWLLRVGTDEGSPVDSVEILAERLRKDPDSRHAYATLWDNRIHLPRGKECPCFVTAFFRRFDGRLTMTATFRAHNAMDAWLENFYGLVAIQKFVSKRSGIAPGSISVISHSISIDPAVLEKAKRIIDEKTSDEVLDPVTGKLGPRMDSHGEFTVTVDKLARELVVEHSFQGMKVGEYRGKSAEQIEKQITRDDAISVVSHAMYLGRELARKEMELKSLQSKGS